MLVTDLPCSLGQSPELFRLIPGRLGGQAVLFGEPTFLLGILTRTARSTGTMIGMLVGLATSLAVGSLSPWVFGRPGVAWTWNVAVGALVTVAVGWTVSRLTYPQAAEPARAD